MADRVDLLIIGGGINGCGIARDAAGRGLSVLLAEKGDLAQATSSASTKLFHGGLRYLEFFEFRLVREALREREVLLGAMPHIAWPMRFVLPLAPDMRFEGDTPASKLLRLVMPWMRGRRPAWMIRLGLFLYDHMGGRKILPGTRTIQLADSAEGAALHDGLTRAYEYSDVWVQDSRLVVLNARDAAARGAQILTRTEVIEARPGAGGWRVVLQTGGERREVVARALVNAAGPWAGHVIGTVLGGEAKARVRLVRGSHIVTRKLFDHDKSYFFQGPDGRIIFAIPYEQDFTLIGTTDMDHPDPDTPPVCTEEEADYLRAFAGRYFRRPIAREDIVWTYSGVRPLYDDGASSATAATRDYVLTLDTGAGAPVLNVFGGKITTYRRLAETAMGKLRAVFDDLPGNWTAGVPLPGGDFEIGGVQRLIDAFRAAQPWADAKTAQRIIRAYGTEATEIFAQGPGGGFRPWALWCRGGLADRPGMGARGRGPAVAAHPAGVAVQYGRAQAVAGSPRHPPSRFEAACMKRFRNRFTRFSKRVRRPSEAVNPKPRNSIPC